jgi:hypothetical protein
LVANWEDPLASLPKGCEFNKNPHTHKGQAFLRDSEGNRIFEEVLSKYSVEGVERRHKARVPLFGPERDYESGWIRFPPDHGFIAGCVWADDSTWKIQYLDLSQAERGIIQREDRFGYIELPCSVLLRQAIELNHPLEGYSDSGTVEIALRTVWDLDTGKLRLPEICGVEKHQV